ncbi:adipokinetic hormone/corazonin-related peptide receptor variant I isoform X2 [Diachasmimorpha longicaudata]|uniref:adipokinetic hormone/corazonin-related peptide receptor variant I isoform X2 n=1 Tax=Diachasmimorpha longicaudata TaxID=58733 RepID=UPI0030B8D54E
MEKSQASLSNLSTILNQTDMELPIDMRFNEGHMVSIITYSILMVISIIGNSTVLFLILQRRRSNRSRINTMLLHLAVADLMVAVLMMPLEIGWAITVSWRAGDSMCRIMAFFRIFGIYLSSFILICISVDRYYAVLRPLLLTDVDRRGKIMLVGAWMGAILCSAPQMIIFHVEVHPNYTWYEQCITLNSFPTGGHELTYSLFGMIMTYCVPLIVIIFTYSSILLEIYKKSRESVHDKIRRSSLGFLGRAKIRTLKMTIIIVLVFFVCWTPYYIMSIWYWYDPKSAKSVDQRVQRALFLFACTNSCMNPIVYGAFNIRTNAKNSTSRHGGTIGKRISIENVVCRVTWKRPGTGSREPSLPNQDTPDTDVSLNIANQLSHTIGINHDSKGDQPNPQLFIKSQLLRYYPLSWHWIIWKLRNKFYIT